VGESIQVTVRNILVSARVESVSLPLPRGCASQAVVASDSYYSTHPYDVNTIGQRPIIFAHRSLQLSDVETLHCAVSQCSKVVPVVTVERGVSGNTRLNFRRGDRTKTIMDILLPVLIVVFVCHVQRNHMSKVIIISLFPI